MLRKLQRLPNQKVGVALGKGPPKKDDDEVQSLQERLAAYNLGPSSDPSAAMETEQPQEPAGKKALIAEDQEDQEDFLIPDNSGSTLDDEPKLSIILCRTSCRDEISNGNV